MHTAGLKASGNEKKLHSENALLTHQIVNGHALQTYESTHLDYDCVKFTGKTYRECTAGNAREEECRAESEETFHDWQDGLGCFLTKIQRNPWPFIHEARHKYQSRHGAVWPTFSGEYGPIRQQYGLHHLIQNKSQQQALCTQLWMVWTTHMLASSSMYHEDLFSFLGTITRH